MLDLAAGTGKFTRLLVPSGAELVAVEPVAAMRDELVRPVPGVEALDGTAEDLPLGDGSVDAVVSAQAFHWFDAPPALAEVHRVLRAGGRLALVWNVRDERVDWVRQFGDDPGGRGRPQALRRRHRLGRRGRRRRWVRTAAPRARSTYDQPIDADLLVQRAASTSFVSALPDGQRARCLDEVRELTRTHPDLAGRDTFVFPYLTDVFWCERA